MFSPKIYFLAVVMTVAIVNCEEFEIELSSEISYLEDQCRLQGYPGACSKVNYNGDELDCEDVACALSDGLGNYTAESMGPAYDGTKCAEGKICYEGSCLSSTSVPVQTGRGGEYNCIDL